MQTTSTEFFNKINSLSQTTCLKASLTYRNAAGETVTDELTADDFFGDGVKTVSDCMSSGDFTFGGTVCKEITCTLDNTKEKYHGCNFTDGKIVVYSGIVLDDGSEEYIKLGEFNLTKAGKPATIVKLTGYDNMLKFDVPIGDDFVGAMHTVGDIVSEACYRCGMELYTTFANSDISITQEFSNTTTWREMIGWCAAVAGGFARIDRDGKLEIVTFSKENAYEINPETTRLDIEVEDHHEITGLIYYGKKEPIIFGNKIYPIIIEENDVFEMMSESDLKTMLEGLYNKFVGHIYCGFTLNYLGNPALDEGDYLYLPSAQGDNVYALCGKCEFKHMGKSTLSCPSVSYYDKQYDQGNRENNEGEETEATGKNLLLISQFTRAFLPYNFVGKWNYTNYNTNGVECLDTYLMCTKTYFNKIWLPFQGDIKKEKKYTLSLLMKARDKRQTPTYKICLVPSYNMNSGNKIVLNDIANKVKSPKDDNSSTFILGEITLTGDWEWHTLTFTAPSNLTYQDDATGDILGTRGYMIALYADQNGLYGQSTYINYAAYLHRAKLEEGESATDWCLGEAENVSIHETYDDFGRTTNTISSVVNSQIAVYNENQLEIGPTTIYCTEAGKTMLIRQKRVENDIVNQILMGSKNLNTANDSLQPSGVISIYSGKSDNSLRISAPGGFYINGTLYE